MRRVRARVSVMIGIVLAWCACSFALDPSLNISQYAHTAWKVRDGFFKSGITTIAQTPDGYLWLGTDFGLLRFDGVRFVPWQPPEDQHLPSKSILALLVSSDGTLWIGARKGLASWKNGKLNQYGDLDGQSAAKLLEDREGTIWVGTLGIPTGRLCAIQNGSLHCYGQDGVFGFGILGLYEDSKGNLWIGVSNGAWRWNPGPSTFYPMPGESDSIRSFVEDDKGELLISTRKEIRRFVDGKTEPYPRLENIGSSRTEMMLRDREGSLWVSTSERGLIHVHQGRADVYTHTDGLSGDATSRLFEDREGSIWVATLSGLDRFRGYAVSTISVKEGLSNDSAWSVLASRDGAVWIGAYGGLNRWENGQITMFGSFTGRDESNGTQKGDLPNALFQDDRGRIWVSTIRGLGYLENGRFIRIEAVPGGAVASIAEDKAGDLWICNVQAGLIHLRRDGTVQQIPWAALERTDFSRALVVDPKAGGLWIGFWQGGIVYFNEGHISSRYSAADGLGGGPVFDLRANKDGTLWAATEGGLSRLKDGRVATLTRRNGLPCDAVHWTIEDDDHSVWLYMPCGLVRIARSELDGWMANPNRTVQATVFDSSDGVISRDLAGGYFPKVTKSSDGRLWFLPGDGVSVIDPRHLPVNKLPPPVHIEQIVADGKAFEAVKGLRLPPQVRDLTIDYTALSLVSPEKVRFRYKLEGQDPSWREVVNGRQVQYSNLMPRNYRFRVMASNNNGVWNEQGASLDFAVSPAYWQTIWFRVLCVAAFLGLLWGLYRLRLRQLAREFNLALEARVEERTRIGRELHDTLLQSFQGVLLKFHALTYLLQDRPEVQKTLENTIEQARRALTEGRDAVHGLRSSTVITNDLAQAIQMLGDDLASQKSDGNRPDFRVHVEGPARDLAPLVRDDVYRVAAEALRNAFQHSDSGRIEAEIRYDPGKLRVKVRDNGKGIDASVLDGGGRAGHYGLAGMSERAQGLGGKLEVRSGTDSGTEVELIIPASVAYAKPHSSRRSLFSRKSI